MPQEGMPMPIQQGAEQGMPPGLTGLQQPI
jgi:hypothetical protein